MKAVYDKLTAVIIFNSKKLKVFTLRLGERQQCPLLLLLCNLILEILVTTIRQGKDVKRIQIGKEVKPFLDNMIL